MPEIQTFVFMDLEATGLDEPGHSSRITEMCFMAVHRSSLIESPNHNQPPRVLDKLVLCVDPKIKENAHVPGLTGLSRALLQQNGRGVFSEEIGQLVVGFLKRQASPVCLIAHSGDRFDFPKIAKHLREVGVTIPINILCGCSFHGFKAVKSKPAGGWSLGSLYRRYVGRSPADDHRAEADVTTLLQLIHYTATEMMPWFDRNARPLCLTR